MNSLVQQRKYTKAKQEVGKIWSILLEAVDDLQDMGIIKPDMVEQKNQGKEWNGYNVIKIRRTELDAIVAPITEPNKQHFLATMKQCNSTQNSARKGIRTP